MSRKFKVPGIIGWHGQNRLSVRSVSIYWKHGQTKFVHATTQINDKVPKVVPEADSPDA